MRHSPTFRANVALQATRQETTIAELAREHPVQISQWKMQPFDGVEDLFAQGSSKRSPDPETLHGRHHE